MLNQGGKRIIERVGVMAERFPDKTAILHGDQKIPYSELWTLVRSGAEFIRKGLPGAWPVGICLRRSPELYVAILSVLATGRAYAPIDPSFPLVRRREMVEGLGHPPIIVENGLLDGAFDGCETCSELPKTGASVEFEMPVVRNPQTYVIHTSGSTWIPKGVVMGEGALLNLLDWQSEISNGPSVNHVTLQFSPIGFDVSFQEVFATLCFWWTLVTISEEERSNPFQLVEKVEAAGVTRVFLPYRALDSFCRAASDRANGLLEVVTAWESLKLTPSIREFFNKRPNCALWNQYWPTETHVITAHKVDGFDGTDALPPIGKPIPNVRIRLLDESGLPVPDGEIGEIHVFWTALADWYFGKEKLTDERFAQTDEGRRYRTWDLAHWDSSGNLRYLGRNDRQVKVRWYRIELDEVESAISIQEGVESCAVGLDEEDWQSILRAFVVLRGGVLLDSDSIRSSVARRLPDYMVPSRFHFVGAIPLSPTGKTDMRGLLDRFVKADCAENRTSPPSVDEVESATMEIWESLLGAWFDEEANFFEIGWTSLLAAQLSVRVSWKFGKPISELLVYERSTFRKYCEAIEEALFPN